MKLDLIRTRIKHGAAPVFARVRSSRARHRWIVGGIAILASGTIAAIQLDPSASQNVESALVISVPQEIVQFPTPEEGMQSVSGLPRIQSGASGDIAPDASGVFRWQNLVVRPGDTLASILGSRRLYSPAVHHALTSNLSAYSLNDLLPGRKLNLGIDADGLLKELAYETDDDGMLLMAREHDGSYSTHHQKRRYSVRRSYRSATIEDSLFAAGKRARLSDRLIMGVAGIFSWDIDFALDLRRGDTFTVIYEEKYWRGEKIAEGDIVAAEFVNRGHRYRAIALKDGNGEVRYYTPNGRSMQRQFLKTPVQFSRISSRFTRGRYHPILKRWRAHKGVDYAASTGTPVRATAAGRILFRNRKGGYGKTVIIRHGSKYSTLYAHLSRYRRGQRAGSLVEQGEIIGYVGQTGLATGPHLHYEFLVNGRHRNPLTVKLPRRRPIDDGHRSEFLKIAQNWNSELERISGRVQVAQNQR
jgi:murein DD-endopeptidase MepM/ murein hydrolase activator NlpD